MVEDDELVVKLLDQWTAKLAGEEDWQLRRDAAYWLGKFGDGQAVESLSLALSDENPGVRSEAVRAMEKIGDAVAIEPLSRALTDEDAFVRSVAVGALGSIGGRHELPLLKARLRIIGGERDNAVRTPIRAAISKIESATSDMAGLPRATEAEMPGTAGRPRTDDNSVTPDNEPR